MPILYGMEGLNQSKQSPFPPQLLCRCGGRADPAFVYAEDGSEPKTVSSVRLNGGPGEYWPHDRVSVAVYICRRCFDVVAKLSQE